MLEIDDVTLTVGNSGEGRKLLNKVSAQFFPGHFTAVIGPSGCGKTTLLKLIAGIASGREDGTIRWRGRDLGDQDFHASEIAYVPQFSIAHEELTVEECVRFSLALRVAAKKNDCQQVARNLLQKVGLSGKEGQLVGTLSGGQRRRLALAIELSSHPHILLCDEVTSGLDPQSEREIVDLLHRLSRSDGRTVLSVTHSLANLEYYDSIVVLYEGELAYCGHPSNLTAYFGVENAEMLYARLKEHPSTAWGKGWRHNVASGEADDFAGGRDVAAETVPRSPGPLPGPLSQFQALLARRFLILSRNGSQIILQLALILGFPLLVAIFAWGGLPEVRNLRMGLSSELSQSYDEQREFLEHATEVGSLVSGIVMFQVILLTLMGANNAGREIASERAIFEKERLAGLRPSCYVASKAVFLFFFVAVQSFWMAGFVNVVCDIPGSFAEQAGFLLLVNGAVTAICLGISSLMPTAEQASLASIYLVGFQLPLSGAVLALPEALGVMVRPFIAAYWSWSGFLQTLQNERYYDIVNSVVQSPLASSSVSVIILATHVVVGLGTAWVGCERHRSL